jgi:molybdate transport system substrate-binding protein
VRRLTALLAVVVVAGCGASSAGDTPRLTVSAATSLKAAMTGYGAGFEEATVRFSFAGSDELAAQIRQGAKPDVFASANTKLPDQLYAEGKVEKPQVFAGNRLVLAVPAEGSDVSSLADARREGTTLAIGSESVPIGSYTRSVLGKMPGAQREAILDNVRSEEPDVAGIVGKLTQGAVDAGFAYVSDVRSAGGKLKAIELPEHLQPSVAYGVAVVKGASQPAQAKAFVEGLLSGEGARALRDAGFDPPPSG